MMSKSFLSLVAVSAFLVQSSLAITYAPNCNAYLSTMKTGILDAQEMADLAFSTLNTEVPFQNHPPFAKPWQALRQTLFGAEEVTKQKDIMNLYHQIASTDDVTIWCDEPPNAIAGLRGCARRCENFVGDGTGYLDAYRMILVDTPTTHQDYEDDKACGFSDGNNIVLCPEILPKGKRGWSQLKDLHPAAGDSIEKYKSTYGFTFVHEFTHLYGGEDFTQDPNPASSYTYGYGFAAAVKIAFDTIFGVNESRPSKGAAEPIRNPDTLAFFALALSQISTPHMDQFSWVTGNAESYVVE